jgi:hypothetical protein
VFPIIRFFGFLDLGRSEIIDLQFRLIRFPNGCFLVDSKHGILGNRLDPWKYIPIRKVIIGLQFSRVIITILTIYFDFSIQTPESLTSFNGAQFMNYQGNPSNIHFSDYIRTDYTTFCMIFNTIHSLPYKSRKSTTTSSSKSTTIPRLTARDTT